MNREILFRGKSLESGDWEFGYVFDDDSTESTRFFVGRLVIQDYIGPCDGRYIVDYAFDEVNPSTIGQYTGLTDKNGKKIFEGDVLVFIDPDTQEFDNNERFVVRWVECQARYFFEVFNKGCPMGFEEILKSDSQDYEIIGNIYDNPELLEEP